MFVESWNKKIAGDTDYLQLTYTWGESEYQNLDGTEDGDCKGYYLVAFGGAENYYMMGVSYQR